MDGFSGNSGVICFGSDQQPGPGRVKILQVSWYNKPLLPSTDLIVGGVGPSSPTRPLCRYEGRGLPLNAQASSPFPKEIVTPSRSDHRNRPPL
ncbi:unnamed protein product [Musa acuminata subsp. malaccensis]|nr:unnamed protein product [Musa acuminata subsp. malaccensis]